MTRGALKVLTSCAGVCPGESVLIVTDFTTSEFAMPLVSASMMIGAKPTVISMEPRDTDSQEPPSIVAQAMRDCDVFIALVGRSITHTQALKDAIATGSRGLMMTQFVPEMLIEGGIQADFDEIRPICEEMASLFHEGECLHLVTGDGLQLTADIRGRRGNALTARVRSGQFALIPTVEANVSPVEGTSRGEVFIDGSIPYEDIGVLSEPMVLEISDGYVSAIRGGSQASRLRSLLEAKGDHEVYNVAEVGVGMNPACKMCGLMLEDEGVFGSVHIGIGTSITLGGSVIAACHYDLITLRPTLRIDDRVVIREGEILI